ncbi:MAG: phosphate-binding protein, partial [Pseudomonadales bacterium]|nr:phosphate-binding protein [Pseudomonadales bacterium]
PVEATEANALNKSYPLSRYLYVYVNQEPDKALAPIEREFIKLILSKQGQQVVVKDGYVPLPASVAAEDLAKIK